ncbi:MAG: LD-carboxypeptidase [Bacteroidales bacterium]|jgi:muramoyltetrapeptide carboxypeptidase|nr:LD-carboxypeptidase [Bacteroidales bacterium]
MKIRIVSPAGSIKSRVVEAGMATLRSWGHDVTLAANALESYGRFAGTPEERASDIVEALRDPDVDLLWATRGGYGCMQILDMIPLDLVREAKKPIVGYSDITALHALWHKAGVKSLHAPMMKHLGEEPTHRTTRTLREVVAYYEKHGQFPPRHNGLFVRDWNAEHPEAQILADEVAFVGGNLSVLSGLHGTPYDYDYEGKILFVEDISESPYKIDRMMQQLRLMGVLDKVRALVCGHFTGCDEDPLMPVKLWDNIRWIASPSGIPVIMGAHIGHEVENFPVVVG